MSIPYRNWKHHQGKGEWKVYLGIAIFIITLYVAIKIFGTHFYNYRICNRTEEILRLAASEPDKGLENNIISMAKKDYAIELDPKNVKVERVGTPAGRVGERKVTATIEYIVTVNFPYVKWKYVHKFENIVGPIRVLN